MTKDQFDALVKLMRGEPDSPSCKAARAVLVDGVRQADAMRACQVARTTVSTTVKRYREADELVRKVYCS